MHARRPEQHARMPRARRPRLGLYLPELDPSLETDSVRRTNAVIRQLLARRYELAEPQHADLIVQGALTRAPEAGWVAPRLIFAHGALGDPGHWLLTVPQVRACDVLALTSSSDRAIFERLAGEPRCRTAWLPLFVDTNVFQPRPALRSAVRERFGVPEHAPLLLTVSALAPGKNVQSALLLLRELRRELPEARCLVVGDGPQAYLADLAQRLGLAAAVSFVGPRSRAELSDLYAAADLLVHLTLNRKESFGLVSVEAQASGVPVLAARWGGVADTVEHGVTGYLADSYLVGPERRVDWLALVPHASELLTNPASWRRFSQAARKRALREHSIAAFARRLYRLLDRMTATPDRRPLRLSPAAQDLVVAFASRAIEHPELTDSAELSESLRDPFDGTYAYRNIHEQMALPHPPERNAEAIAYRLLDAELDGQTLHIRDPMWKGSVPLTAAERAVWQLLETPRPRADVEARAPTNQAALATLYARGLAGLTRRASD